MRGAAASRSPRKIHSMFALRRARQTEHFTPRSRVHVFPSFHLMRSVRYIVPAASGHAQRYPLLLSARKRGESSSAARSRALLARRRRQCLLARCGPPAPGGAQACSSRTHLRSRGQRFMPNIHQAHPTISVADSAPVLRALPAPCLPGQAACNSLCPNTQKLCAPSLARIACEHSNKGRGNKAAVC